MLHCRGSLGSDHARFLRGFALARKRRRYLRALSIPSAACLPMLGICGGYPVPLVRKADPTSAFSASAKSERRLTSQLT
jgi:hypothetical protein